MDRDEAFAILRKYNKDDFHIRHALTMEEVMRWFAREMGYGQEAERWAIAGMLHDIDFELYPSEHCVKAVELLEREGADESLIHSVVSHGYGIEMANGMVIDVKPEHLMEKILFACDELTGLVWSASLMRPSKSVKDMELPSLKKKFKDRKFAAGCSRDVIRRGADMLGWGLDELLDKTLCAMRDCEDAIGAKFEEYRNSNG